MPDSEPYNDILFDKNTDAPCAWIMYDIKIGGELITDDHATFALRQIALRLAFIILNFLFLLNLILLKFLRK